MDLTDARSALDGFLRDAAGVLITAEKDVHLGQAVRRYSRLRANEIVVDIAGDGTFSYALPASFDAVSSEVLSIEYPVGERIPFMVAPDDWLLYESPTGFELRFLALTPATGKTIRLTHSATHVLDDNVATTIPADDLDAVILCAAGFAFEALASHFADSIDSSLNADSTDHSNQAREYSTRSRRMLKLADEMVRGLGSAETHRAASAEASLGDDVSPLTHPTR